MPPNRHADLQPKRVPFGSVLYQHLPLVLQNEREVPEMILELRPDSHRTPAVAVSEPKIVLPVIGGLKEAETVQADGSFL